MSYLVFAFGLALSIGGAFAIYFGYGIIAVERGWASVIAGAAALSGGVVTMALGLILDSLSRLRIVLESEQSAFPLPGEVRLYPEDDYSDAPYAEPDRPDAFEAPETGVDFEDAPEGASWRHPPPAAETMEDIRRIVAEKVRARTGIADAPPNDADPNPHESAGPPQFADEGFDEAEDYDPRPAEQSAPESIGRPVDSSTFADPPPAQAEHDFGERPADREAVERVVTRRYESAGTVYVMYDDGSIEAQTEHGVMHFDSMIELKAFMDSGARGPS
jgi:hypothetical protein